MGTFEGAVCDEATAQTAQFWAMGIVSTRLVVQHHSPGGNTRYALFEPILQ